MVLLKEVEQFVTLHVLRDMEREGQVSLELRLPSEAVFVNERICPSLKGIDGLLESWTLQSSDNWVKALVSLSANFFLSESFIQRGMRLSYLLFISAKF